jgi:hypothetical protein
LVDSARETTSGADFESGLWRQRIPTRQSRSDPSTPIAAAAALVMMDEELEPVESAGIATTAGSNADTMASVMSRVPSARMLLVRLSEAPDTLVSTSAVFVPGEYPTGLVSA